MYDQKTTIHLEIGPIIVITRSDQTGYFWIDRRDQLGAGPFLTMYSALRHFSDLEKAKKHLMLAPEVPPKQNVLTVDFQNKRRIL